MARVINNLVVDGAVGALGDQLVLKRARSGRTILSRKPHFDPHRVFSPAQLARQAAFREAAAYASRAQRQPVYIARARGTRRIPYNLAIGDWLHPPQVTEIDLEGWNGQAGQAIRVRAQDDFLVARVEISILDGDGALLETGEATRSDGLWEYTTTSSASHPGARVQARAWDLPGHVARLEKVKPAGQPS